MKAKGVQAVIEEALERGKLADPREVADADRRLEELLDKVDTSSAAPAPATDEPGAAAAEPVEAAVTRVARPIALSGGRVRLMLRGREAELVAELAPGVSAEVVAAAIETGDSVVLECLRGEPPMIVGVLTTRMPEELVVRARKVRLEADEELLLRSGRGALRIRKDGDIEIVGTRLAAMSRGLFRLVGRVLRLN